MRWLRLHAFSIAQPTAIHIERADNIETALTKDRFTKADVEYLIATPKFIKAVPRVQLLDSVRKTGWKMQSEIYSKADSNRPIVGLVIMAKCYQSPSGLPRPTPSSALEWHGRRIRGLNYELWHDNPDGTIVKGWHEHIWSPAEQDARVIEARPEVTQRDVRGVFAWGLKKWGIDIMMEQEAMANA